MGAPGIRFPGKGYTATEVWLLGDSLLETLFLNLPQDWVAGDGLPAWADRLGTTAVTADGHLHPLWAATWSGNTAACHWEGEELTGVRIGGIPANWYLPQQGQDKKTRKDWWDARNLADPCYLVVADNKGVLRTRRVDLGRDATELAVDWNAHGSPSEVRKRSHRRVKAASEEHGVFFFRHLIEGTASSPAIRRSEVLVPDSSAWAPTEDHAELLQYCADSIQKLHNIACSPFRRKGPTTHNVPVLDNLENRKGDASTQFWRNISTVFEEYVNAISQHSNEDLAFEVPEETWRRARTAALTAFRQVAGPATEQSPGRMAAADHWVKSRLDRVANPFPETPRAEES